MRAVIVTPTMQIPVGADWFDRILASGGTARRTISNGPGEQWIVEEKGADPVILVVNSYSEASETLASMKGK